MKNQISKKKFDYGVMEKTSADLLMHTSAQLRKNLEQGSSLLMDSGKLCCNAQRVFAVSGCKGQFSEWIRDECPLSRASVYRLINGFNRLHSEKKSLPYLDSSAIEEISKDGIDSEAIKEAIKQSGAGNYLAKEDVINIKKLVKKSPEVKEVDDDDYEVVEQGKPDEVVEPEPVLDALKRPVTGARLIEVFTAAKEFDGHARTLDAILKWGEEVSGNGIGEHLDLNALFDDIRRLRMNIQGARPYVVCPKCQGDGGNCPWCKSGWLIMGQHSAAVAFLEKS